MRLFGVALLWRMPVVTVTFGFFVRGLRKQGHRIGHKCHIASDIDCSTGSRSVHRAFQYFLALLCLSFRIRRGLRTTWQGRGPGIGSKF